MSFQNKKPIYGETEPPNRSEWDDRLLPFWSEQLSNIDKHVDNIIGELGEYQTHFIHKIKDDLKKAVLASLEKKIDAVAEDSARRRREEEPTDLILNSTSTNVQIMDATARMTDNLKEHEELFGHQQPIKKKVESTAAVNATVDIRDSQDSNFQDENSKKIFDKLQDYIAHRSRSGKRDGHAGTGTGKKSKTDWESRAARFFQ